MTAIGAALAFTATACVNDTHELAGDRLSCRTPNGVTHTAQIGVQRSGSIAGLMSIDSIARDSSVTSMVTYIETNRVWRPHVTGRSGRIGLRVSGGAILNTAIATTNGSCLATGSVYWEGHFSG